MNIFPNDQHIWINYTALRLKNDISTKINWIFSWKFKSRMMWDQDTIHDLTKPSLDPSNTVWNTCTVSVLSSRFQLHCVFLCYTLTRYPATCIHISVHWYANKCRPENQTCIYVYVHLPHDIVPNKIIQHRKFNLAIRRHVCTFHSNI